MRVRLIVLGAAALAVVVAITPACGSDSSDDAAPGTTAAPTPPPATAVPAPTTAPGTTTRQAAAPALPGLPADIRGFQSWTRMNFTPLPDRGGSAHQGVKRVYVNQERSTLVRGGQQQFPFPAGTIVVKTASDGGVITLVAIGRKPQAGKGGWEWIEYTRGGSRDPFAFLAAGDVCSNCHVGAESTDWIFTRIR